MVLHLVGKFWDVLMYKMFVGVSALQNESFDEGRIRRVRVYCYYFLLGLKFGGKLVQKM